VLWICYRYEQFGGMDSPPAHLLGILAILAIFDTLPLFVPSLGLSHRTAYTFNLTHIRALLCTAMGQVEEKVTAINGSSLHLTVTAAMCNLPFTKPHFKSHTEKASHADTARV
jgi:uncharacterized membrane protein